MAGQEFEKAKEKDVQNEPPSVAEPAGPRWRLSEADGETSFDPAYFDEVSGADGLDSVDGVSRAPGLDSIDEISNSATHFGTAFQRAIILSPGAIIGGSYRIIKLIGKGGMGQVYLVEHMTLAKKCALKIMPSNQVTEKAWIRFQSEAKSIAGLDHSNLVRVTDLGIHESSLPFFAMEYVDGQSLAQRLSERGPMDQATTLQVLLQICEGIECAHKKGIVHRDLKPANIMLVEDRQKPGLLKVKILDFGLAKLSQREAAEVNLTATGEIFGSPLYMSPEQCAGENTDMRTDIYSLGCTLFECLTGKPPFTGEMAIPIMNRKIFNEAPPLQSAAGSRIFMPQLNEITAMMLKKDPSARYQTIAELKNDVLAAIRGEPLAAKPFRGDAGANTKNNAVIVGREDINTAGSGTANNGDNATFGDKIDGGGGGGGEGAEGGEGGKRGKRSHRRPSNLIWAASCLVLGLSVVAAIRVSAPDAPAGSYSPSMLTRSAEVFTTSDPESLLRIVQRLYGEQRPGNQYPRHRYNVNVLTALDTSNLVRDVETRLGNMGASAIPVCVQDFALQTTSSGVSGRVLVANGAAATEPLLHLLQQKPTLASKIVFLLHQLGPNVGDCLCRRATTGNAEDKDFAIRTMGQLANLEKLHIYVIEGLRKPFMTEANRQTILELLKADANPEHQKDLIDTLSYFHGPDLLEITMLSNILLTSQNEEVQQAAARSLGAMLSGSSQKPARLIIQALTQEAIHPHQAEASKIASLDALAKAKGPLTSAQIAQIAITTQDFSEAVQQKGLQTLAALVPENPQCMPYLKLALQQRDPVTLQNAFTVTSQMGPAAESLMPELIKLAQDKFAHTSGRALMAISAVGVEHSPEARAVLCQALRQEPHADNWSQLLAIIRCYQQLGANGKDAIPALQKLAKDRHFPYRNDAKQAAEAIINSP